MIILFVFMLGVINQCKGENISAYGNFYTFEYKTAFLNKKWFKNGYEIKYYFLEDDIIGALGKIFNYSYTISSTEKGWYRVGKVVIGKYVKNGFKILKQMDIQENTIYLNINLGEIGFYWYLMGKTPPIDAKYLFQWDSLFKNRILTSEGIYALPISGYNTDGWFLTPSLYWEFAVLNGYYGGQNIWLQKNAGWGIYYYPQLISLVYVSLISNSKEGVLFTQPASIYLKKLYGFEEEFFDTRFNTDLADFLVQVGYKINEPSDIWAARKYKKYLLQHAEKYHWRIKTGLLIADYFWKNNALIITHASLNHNLAEINFLLRLGDEDGLQLAQKILTAVRLTKNKWIAPNGDLYYAYYGNSNYGGKDYLELTLRDLKTTKQLLSYYNWGHEYLSDIEYLIQTKIQYLSENKGR